MKILCIGDSLSLPGHTNLYEDTWFYKLKQAYPKNDFISFFKRHLTTDILNSMGGGENFEGAFPTGADCLEHYMPNIVILQLGIVDCAPRLIDNKKFIWKIVRRMPNYFVQKYIKHLKKTPRNPKNVVVSSAIFKNNLIKYFARCQQIGVKQLIFIAIPIPGKKMTNKNENISVNVKKYNQIIEDISLKYDFIRIVYPLIENKNCSIYDDGYHPNPIGNNLIYNSISPILHKA